MRRLHLDEFLLLLVVWGSVCPGRILAQPSQPLEGFEARVATLVEDWEVPGLAVGVVKDGQVVFAQGFGVRRLGSNDAVDSRTRFAIGSTTKAMTAASIGMLVDEGKLKWDDRVIDHLKGFRIADPYVTSQITVRDLLTHRTGLGNSDLLWYGRENSTAEILRRLQFLEPRESLRSHFIYQNVMYATAGELVAAVSGMSWGDFVQRRIFQPLGMLGARTHLAALENADNVAAPHDLVDGTLQEIRNAPVDSVAAAGSIWAGIDDMLRWIAMLLNQGKTPTSGEALFSEKTLEEMFSPQVIVDEEQFYPTARLTLPKWRTYGLGWFQQDYRGHAVDFHTGSIDGMVAIIGLIRSEKLGICVLANRDHAEVRHALMLEVFDRFLGQNGRNWSAELRELYGKLQDERNERRRKQQEGRHLGTQPSLTLEGYLGTFDHPVYGSVRITTQAGKLRLELGPSSGGELNHWHYDTFEIRWDRPWRDSGLVNFHLGADGKVRSLETLGLAFNRRTQ